MRELYSKVGRRDRQPPWHRPGPGRPGEPQDGAVASGRAARRRSGPPGAAAGGPGTQAGKPPLRRPSHSHPTYPQARQLPCRGRASPSPELARDRDSGHGGHSTTVIYVKR